MPADNHTKHKYHESHTSYKKVINMAKITVVGLGPGSLLDMTPRALQAIEQAEVVAGYNTYIKLIEELLEDGSKEVIGTGMMQEIDRCRMAVEIAASGKETVVVSSGDAGVYGMAAPMYELLEEYEEKPGYEEIKLSVVSGVTAARGMMPLSPGR